MSTFMANRDNTVQDWYIVDANGLTLGRLASKLASILRGKHKPTFTPHVDTGDFVVVVNAAGIKLTGNKAQDKTHYHHTGYPGGIKETKTAEMPAEKMLMLAVKRMLPRNPLGRKMLTKLRVFSGAEHNHQAQKPVELQLGD